MEANKIHDKLDNSILKGINYLHQNQFPNGEFCCYIGHEDSMKETVPDANVFPTSLIGYSLLNLIHLPKVNDMLQLAASFLQAQVMHGGVWNNFTKAHPYFKVCPADVDNTACASIFLKALNRDFQDNKEILLANRNHSSKLFYSWYTFRLKLVFNKDYWRLSLREFKYPFRTLMFWINVEANKNDIDGAINANVLFYLGLNQETMTIPDLMLQIISSNKEDDCDKWYRNPFTIYYFFSRIIAKNIPQLEPIRTPIIERIINTKKNDGSFGANALDTALGIISLIKLNHISAEVESAVKYLLANQGEYGQWVRWAIYYGGPKKLQCYGSEEITTGYCLEALALYKLTREIK